MMAHWLVRTAFGACSALVGHLLREVWGNHTPGDPEGVGYLTIGRMAGHTPHLGRLTKMLDYSRPRAGIKFGGGGYHRRGNRLIGGDGLGGGASRRGKLLRTGYGAGGGGAWVGQTIYDSPTMTVYPLIGAGGWGEGLGIRPRQPHDANPLASAWTGGPQLQLGWGTEFRVRLTPTAGILLGLHTGWYVRLLPVPWFRRGWKAAPLPGIRIVRPYFKLIVGGFVNPVAWSTPDTASE